MTHETFNRNLWTHYLQNNDALIFIVDCSDKERFREASEELWDLLTRDELRDTPLLVWANKQVTFPVWNLHFRSPTSGLIA